MHKLKVVLLLAALALCILPTCFASVTAPKEVLFSYPEYGATLQFNQTMTFQSCFRQADGNNTFGEYWFFTLAATTYGVLCIGTSIVVDNFFQSGVVNFSASGKGTVYVYAPPSQFQASGVSGAIILYNTGSTTPGVTALSISTPTFVTLQYIVEANTTQGGSWINPSPQPSTSPAPLLQNSGFQVLNLNLGDVAANSTVHAELQFTFGGSSLNVESVTLSAPFNVWCTTISAQNANVNFVNDVGSVALTFHVPGALGVYNGTVEVQAQDSLGVTYMSNGDVSANVVSNSWISQGSQWIQTHMLYVIAGVAILALIVAVAAAAAARSARSKRRYKRR
jgi:hypothetical protein